MVNGGMDSPSVDSLSRRFKPKVRQIFYSWGDIYLIRPIGVRTGWQTGCRHTARGCLVEEETGKRTRGVTAPSLLLLLYMLLPSYQY